MVATGLSTPSTTTGTVLVEVPEAVLEGHRDPSGGATGVKSEDAAVLVPMTFTAKTVIVYLVPFVKPVKL